MLNGPDLDLDSYFFQLSEEYFSKFSGFFLFSPSNFLSKLRELFEFGLRLSDFKFLFGFSASTSDCDFLLLTFLRNLCQIFPFLGFRCLDFPFLNCASGLNSDCDFSRIFLPIFVDFFSI